ncbi:MAG: phosphatase PAP2 family protein [Eubacteriales bacterium]|nr:phosphatase PAP2 family protein [Eubacteriales bacterium]
MDKLKNMLARILPAYAILPLIFCFLWNNVVYGGSRLINQGLTHYDLTIEFDRMTPVVPEFMLVYFGCFVTWGIFYIMCGRVSREYCARFVAFDVVTRTVCGIIFLILPTYNVRPEVLGTGIFEKLLLFLYEIDAADNLFPSIHCLVSWNCFVGLRNSGYYKKRTVALSAVIAVLVFISTLVTKQHVIADVISAVIISEASWFVCNHTGLYKCVKKSMEWLDLLRKQKRE